MTISQKCQYAVRAVFELSKRRGNGPITIGDLAQKQAIPARFLEIILNELKQGGVVESRRGVQGGYMVVGEPKDITVGRVIRFIDGPLDPVKCIGTQNEKCALKGNCAFNELWLTAKKAVENVYDSTSFQDLIDRERTLSKQTVNDFSI